MRILLITLNIIIAMSFTSAFAQQRGGGGGGGMPVFADIDVDENGSLTPEEMAAMPSRRGSPEERFAMMDADEDGLITEEEFNGFLSNMRGMGGGMGG